MNIIPLERMSRECHWPGCHCEPVEVQIPLCDRHFEYIGQRYINDRTVFGAGFHRATMPTIDEKQAEHEVREAERSARLEAQSVVYYVRIGDHVKIGYTQNLKQRLLGLRLSAENVLATEPGGRLLESQRHQEFAAERVGRREDFNPSRRLLAHIDAVRECHGEPHITSMKTAARRS